MLGTPNANYNIQVNDLTAVQDQSVKPEPGVTSLNVTDLKIFSTTVGAESASGQVGPDGTDTLYVGGTLQVPITAKNGKYRGEVELLISQ